MTCVHGTRFKFAPRSREHARRDRPDRAFAVLVGNAPSQLTAHCLMPIHVYDINRSRSVAVVLRPARRLAYDSGGAARVTLLEDRLNDVAELDHRQRPRPPEAAHRRDASAESEGTAAGQLIRKDLSIDLPSASDCVTLKLMRDEQLEVVGSGKSSIGRNAVSSALSRHLRPSQRAGPSSELRPRPRRAINFLMKLGGILRLLITACLAMAMLAAPQARAHLVPTMSPHGKFAVAMTQVGTQPMDCCPNKHMPAPRTCPECPLMAMCSSPYLDQVRTAEIVRPIRQVLARVMPEDEREGGDHAPSPLRKPPRSQG